MCDTMAIPLVAVTFIPKQVHYSMYDTPQIFKMKTTKLKAEVIIECFRVGCC